MTERMAIFIVHWSCSRIEKEGLTERAIMLCKLNKSQLESSISVGIHKQKVCIPERTFVFNKLVGPKNVKKWFVIM